MKKIRVGIMGGSGYTGGELIRILLNHPEAGIGFVHSNSNAGRPVSSVHRDLVGDTNLSFSGEVTTADVYFLCVGHGEATKVLERYPQIGAAKVIDLSQDHRIDAFVYGLPELQKEKIAGSQHVANPGCFATGIQLSLLPIAKAGMLGGELHVTATTGSTGAGQKFNSASHFSWRQNNLSVYKAFEHQHLSEIGQTIRSLQPQFEGNISFIPHRGSFTRGIFGSLYFDCELTENECVRAYHEYYRNEPFVHVTDDEIDLKQVVNTNKCLLSVRKHGKKLLISFCIDNLLKGASGQAVQNMNLMFGLEETMGLKLKANYF